MYATLKKLLSVTALATGERKICNVIEEMMAPLCTECYYDPLGALICFKKGTAENKKRIMLAAHADESGFVVTFIENDGTLRFDTCGSPDLTAAAYADVEFENGVKGILIPEDSANLNVRRMFVDIGAKNAADAAKKVRSGDFFAISHRLLKKGTEVCGTALDGRLACAALIKAAEKLGETKDDIYFVFTGRATVGYKGAVGAAYSVCPDISVSIGVCGDACTCGKGAAIRIKDAATVYDRRLVCALEDAAKKEKIPYQFEINEKEASEAVAIQTTGAGSVVGGISIPCKRRHTSAEAASLSDAEAAAKLLCAYIGGKE